MVSNTPQEIYFKPACGEDFELDEMMKILAAPSPRKPRQWSSISLMTGAP
jgi:hypothetical protein